LFRRWLADHAGLMWKVVRGFAATPEDQEDLLQEVALKLWMSLPSFQGRAAESTWIYRVALTRRWPGSAGKAAGPPNTKSSWN